MTRGHASEFLRWVISQSKVYVYVQAWANDCILHQEAYLCEVWQTAVYVVLPTGFEISGLQKEYGGFRHYEDGTQVLWPLFYVEVIRGKLVDQDILGQMLQAESTYADDIHQWRKYI